MAHVIAEKHREVAHAWVDGKDVEYFNTYSKKWVEVSYPTWDTATTYRIKKNKVKKWQILYRKEKSIFWSLSALHYTSISKFVGDQMLDSDFVFKIFEESMIEVEE